MLLSLPDYLSPSNITYDTAYSTRSLGLKTATTEELLEAIGLFSSRAHNLVYYTAPFADDIQALVDRGNFLTTHTAIDPETPEPPSDVGPPPTSVTKK